MDRLFLIDGHALMFRMYYAFIRRPMINSKGTDTSVIFGFSRYLLDLIARERPTHLAVAFDPPCKTFRHEAYPEYKATRSAAPEVIKESLEPLTGILKALGIPVLMAPGYEADDVIGSMARLWSSPDCDVYMVSPDKDLGQLISDHVFQVKPGKNGADDEVVDREGICAKFGISDPRQVIDILTIWGDTSDNVPGVKGIGEVGARKLVGRYGSVDGILQHLDELPPKQAAAMREAADHLEMSRFLVTIKTDVDLSACTAGDLRLNLTDATAAAELFNKYECPSLLPLLPAAATASVPAAAQKEQPEHLIKMTSDPERFAAAARASGAVGIVMRDNAAHGQTRLFLSTPGDPAPVFCTSDPAAVRGILESEDIVKAGYGLKRRIQELRREGIDMKGPLADLELMHYLVNPETSHRPETLVQSYLGLDLSLCRSTGKETEYAPEADLFSAPADSAPEDDAALDHSDAVDASLMLPLREALLGEFAEDPSIGKIYNEIEMPLIRVLADMEYCGVRIDTDMLAAYGQELGKELSVIEARIREETGEPGLNVSSPIQLGAVLFDKMRLDPKARKNKKGNYSTDEETLTALKDRHPVIGDILQFRAVKKIISTYIEPFPSLIDPRDGRVHTTFNQALTATGRLSSTHPNLQNIPIRTEMGREIRKAFVPSEPGRVIRAALDGRHQRRRRHDRRIPARTRHPHGHCGQGFQGQRGRSHTRAASPGQDRQLRHHLRHIGLRTVAAAGHPAQGSLGTDRRILPALSCHRGVHGEDKERGPGEGLRLDHIRTQAVHQGHQLAQCHSPRVRRAQCHQRPHTGQCGRHHQDGHEPGSRRPARRRFPDTDDTPGT